MIECHGLLSLLGIFLFMMFFFIFSTSGLCLDAVLGIGTDFSAATMFSPVLHYSESIFLPAVFIL